MKNIPRSMATTTVGQSIVRIDARAKVTGQALYPGDLTMPGMVHMKVLFAGRPHARIHRVDTSRAEVYPGVVAMFTARDVPVNEYGLIMPDQPVLCGPGSSKPGADVVRFVGDQVALIVAETEKAATAARDLIQVEYEDRPVVTDPREALKPGAPQILPDRPGNLLIRYRIRKGNVAAGFAQADVIVESDYHTPMQEHAYLQPEAGLACIDEAGRVTVAVAGQWTHEDQKQIAHALGLPQDQVRVIYPAIGGAFGGREDLSVQIILALAAWKLHRPVKIVWSREESIIGHHKRHQMFAHARWGATRDGRLVAAEVDLMLDAGAYAYTSTKVLGNATLICTGPYEIPNVRVDTQAVLTNNIPAGAFRGFGGPQGLFVAEQQMNKLAGRLGIDPVELRRRNLLREGSLLSVGTPLPPGVSIGQVVEKCAEAAGWTPQDDRGRPTATEEGRKQKAEGSKMTSLEDAPLLTDSTVGGPSSAVGRRFRGRGFACGFKNVGFSFGFPERSWATVELHGKGEIEEVVVRHAGADVGQGAHTVMAQMAAEAVGVPLEKVRLIVSDTAETGDSGSASASRMTFMAGNAIKGAAGIARQRWRDEERPAIGTFKYTPPPTTPYDPETGKAEPNFTYGYVAQVVDVAVDSETGQIRIERVVCADDVGRAVNPQQVQGQIEGGVVQAAGWAVLENFQMRDGQVLTPRLSSYLIPGVLDVPDRVESVILEHPDPIGPWGARGMGEMPFLPLAPALTAAVHAATGVWFDELPLTPERVLAGLKGKEALPDLRQGPEKAGALAWEEVRSEWDSPDPELGRDPA
jgi:CO/xanthine dehydrogenase Mo-binding subunit